MKIRIDVRYTALWNVVFVFT